MEPKTESIRERALTAVNDSNWPINAFGRYADDAEWMPFHLADNGTQLDYSGVPILPFCAIKKATPEEMVAWLVDTGNVMFRMSAE